MSGAVFAVLTYGLLIILWSAILVLYLRQRQASRDDEVVRGLLAVLALDALRSLIESGYFGVVWAANYGLLPATMKDLSEPVILAGVKWLNVGISAIILGWLIRRWVPRELAERRALRDAEAALREELERSLAAAKESEHRYKVAAEISRDVVWDWDLRTNEIATSSRIAEWLGHDPTNWEQTSKPWVDSLFPEDKERFGAELKRLLASHEDTMNQRMRLRRADGGTLWVSARGRVVRDAAGVVTRMIGSTRDLSPDIEAEQARLAAQKLESIGVLAGGVAHDFNNLLAVVSTSLGVAHNDANIGKNTKESLALAETAVQRAAALTKQLLAYAGRSTTQRVALDVNQTVRDIAELLKASLPRNVKLSLELGENLPPLLADEGQLQQVVVNLVTNASEAITAEHGMVTVKTSMTNEPRTVKLEVRDTGSGMTPEVQARAFDPFFTTKGSGRGLGLAALAGIVRSVNGAVGIDSSSAGTTFTVTFTELSNDPVPKPKPAPPPKKTSGGLGARVLLVDDEALLRRSANRLLVHLGCTVVEASDGDDAVDVIRKEPTGFDLVLMDVTMPRMSGVVAAKQMLELSPSLAVVLSSGYSRDSLDAEGSLPASVRTLGKPYRVDDLERVIREAVGQTTKG